MVGFGRRPEQLRPPARVKESGAPVSPEEVVDPRAKKWQGLKAAAQGNKAFDDLLNEFAGACAHARLNSVGEKDAARVSRSLEPINEYIGTHKITIDGLTQLELRDLPGVEWEGYQEI